MESDEETERDTDYSSVFETESATSDEDQEDGHHESNIDTEEEQAPQLPPQQTTRTGRTTRRPTWTIDYDMLTE